jgi:hypothetical protein
VFCVLAWPSRPAPPQTANMVMIKAIITNHKAGAKDLTFFRIALSMLSPQNKRVLSQIDIQGILLNTYSQFIPQPNIHPFNFLSKDISI